MYQFLLHVEASKTPRAAPLIPTPNYITYEEFFDAGKAAVRPVLKKYKQLFLSPEGDYPYQRCVLTRPRMS